jgi:hypothetical protein
VHSDTENRDVILGGPIAAARSASAYGVSDASTATSNSHDYLYLSNIDYINTTKHTRSPAGDAETNKSSYCLTISDNSDGTPTTSTSCCGSTLGPLTSQCSVPQSTGSLYMVDNSDHTTVSDVFTNKVPNTLISDTAEELNMFPVDKTCKIGRRTQSNYLTPVKHSSALASGLDNDGYVIATDDSNASCKTRAEKVSPTDQPSGSSQSADDDNKNNIVCIGDSSKTNAAHTDDNYLIPLDNCDN